MQIVNNLGNERFTIYDMTKLSPDSFQNRGGAITDPNIASQKKLLKNICYLPFRQIVINTKGEIRLCCAIHDEVILDNIMHINLFDYFDNNAVLKHYRKELENSREALYPCKDCSYIGDNTEGIKVKLITMSDEECQI
jgi:radical SAM protein with 4Fe4S-binding SPASM domain